jgi:hypothetical protein
MRNAKLARLYARGKVASVDQRNATAYHEAGHAVMTVHLGGWIAEEGVEIDDRQYCHSRFRDTFDARTRQRNLVLNGLAGWRSEHLWHGAGERRDTVDDDLMAVLDGVRNDDDEYEAVAGDDFGAFKDMLHFDPSATNEQLAQRYAEFSVECYVILQKPADWSAVERLANMLIERGKLDSAEVHMAIGEIRA